MKICIIGWYGTETIGDRAILAGIISMMAEKNSELDVCLGSLFPFFTNRTLFEDKVLYKKLSGKEINITVFDSKQKDELENNIDACDLLVMGGGPLMDLEVMYMVLYSFKYAKKKNKKTVVFGCGMGPLFELDKQKCALNILKLADYIVLRDKTSCNNAIELSCNTGIKLSEDRLIAGFDPAVECSYKFYTKIADSQKIANNSMAVVNFRDFPVEYRDGRKADIKGKIDKFLKSLLQNISRDYEKVLLVPMHYFSVGNDDRRYFHELTMYESGFNNVSIQDVPLSLEETMNIFYHADVAIGMRFHSVVLQTILNGNNYALDYTEPKKGKINGFINDIYVGYNHDERICNLQEDLMSLDCVYNSIKKISKINRKMIDDYYKNKKREYDTMLNDLCR